MGDKTEQKDSSGSVAAAVAPPKRKAKPRPKSSGPKDNPRPQPPYAVVVLNDDDHTYEYVIETLCRVCHHPTEKAFQLAEQIDHTGRAVVWSGALEVAELKRDQIKGLGPDLWASRPVTYPLGVELEPLPE